MKHPARVLLGSAVILVCGCNVAMPPGGPSSNPTVTSPASTPAPQPAPLYISGNWQINTTSTTGKQPVSIGGSIVESGGAVTGTMHVNDPACFSQLATIDWTGTWSGSDISLTSAPVDGEVETVTGTITDDSNDHVILSGTYSIKGGCRDGDSGSVAGIYLYIGGYDLDGTFTSSSGQMFSISGGISQYGTPNADGTFGLTGSATFATPCLTTATMTPGTLASGSFMMGDTVGIEFSTSNGTINFAGTLDLSSYDPEFDSYEIKGNYTVSGTCADTGTATLREYNPWDY